ncbi:MAG: glycosyltransferase family 4 protein, partial [Leptospiraceae bacterium]|nr:glycosyltransferase family 4 protein [Leptospiraceae bacterium]
LELYVGELILKLQAAGVPQVVICDPRSFLVARLEQHGVAIEFLKPGSRYSLRRILRLRQIAKTYQIELWHSHQRDDMVLVSLAFFFRKKFRHIFSLYMGFAHKKDLLHRLLYRRLDKLVTSSEIMNAQALEKLPVRRDQLLLIRYGRNEQLFRLAGKKRRAVRKSLGLLPQQRLVLSLCRIDPMKGVREFAEAARICQRKSGGRFLFLQIGERTIVGKTADGSPIYAPEAEACYRELVALARHGGMGATPFAKRKGRKAFPNSFFKLLPFQKDYAPYLAAADYFVLASHDEMYSLSVVDAMLAKCPVIGTATGGTNEQLSGDRGLLVESKNAQAIAEALFGLEKNAKQRQKMVKLANLWALAEHSWKKVLPQWLELYRSAG